MIPGEIQAIELLAESWNKSADNLFTNDEAHIRGMGSGKRHCASDLTAYIEKVKARME